MKSLHRRSRSKLAVRDEEIVGSFAPLIIDNLGHLRAPSAVIEDVVVDPQCRGQGIGTAMMRHALGLRREKGCYKATLSSNLERGRAAFYESLGFERHGYSFRITPLHRHQPTEQYRRMAHTKG